MKKLIFIGILTIMLLISCSNNTKYSGEYSHDYDTRVTNIVLPEGESFHNFEESNTNKYVVTIKTDDSHEVYTVYRIATGRGLEKRYTFTEQ